MWHITLRELKDRRWSLLAYLIGSLVLIWLYVATFRSSQAATAQLQALLKAYPKALLQAIGFSDAKLQTVQVYLNAKHFSLLWPIMAIILALSRAGQQIAGEIRTGTLGLLLAQPLARWRIFAAKYAAGLATILVFTAVSVYGVIPLAWPYGLATDLHVLTSTFILTTLFMWSIYSLGLLISTLASDSGRVYATMTAFLFASYALYIVSLITDSAAKLKYLSVFYYFDTKDALTTGHLMVSSMLVFGGLIVAASALAAWIFTRRDISV